MPCAVPEARLGLRTSNAAGWASALRKPPVSGVEGLPKYGSRWHPCVGS